MTSGALATAGRRVGVTDVYLRSLIFLYLDVFRPQGLTHFIQNARQSRFKFLPMVRIVLFNHKFNRPIC
jgi:hypothetical protein